MENKHLDNLIGRMQRYGDEEAFAEFYKLTAKGLYSYLMSVVGKKENAEDLMQDTYIRFRQNVQSYVRGTNPSAYLIQIGKNLALNFLKRSGYERQTDFSEWEDSKVARLSGAKTPRNRRNYEKTARHGAMDL